MGILCDTLKEAGLQCFKALCCKGPPPPRPEYDLVCIGLTGSGKTSLLSQLCCESQENIVSTTGFSIKAVPFQNAVLNVKELGGADTIRKYWSRYYQGSQGVIFVLDSASSEDDLETARNELHSALQHPQLCTLPFLILANHQDKPAARSVQEGHSPGSLSDAFLLPWRGCLLCLSPISSHAQGPAHGLERGAKISGSWLSFCEKALH
ncbi:ADP-ribosylation factor-like protein 15 isoform X1 [Mauremys mutica]|uniref:ADP-ribosylation factor-like protein 15 isoform X1 n=1 Tax=Mauremys mutica TaxID=74926 RepID=UPI001D1646C0|nr:ADP-ribosylation factor-like protein 15 isoform X1 [Mauremys mutica]XP_044877486.1 ADP-ribosylation factor-like protein 15 isoform X1 [Mauremys mutica]